MEGNRGLLYVRVMRTPSAVIYGRDYVFEFGKGHVLRETGDDAAVIVSSGRGVHEALAAADECAARGLTVGVVDMPSIDEDLLVELCESGKARLPGRTEQRLHPAEPAEGPLSAAHRRPRRAGLGQR